jgi:hypothetical protein
MRSFRIRKPDGGFDFSDYSNEKLRAEDDEEEGEDA